MNIVLWNKESKMCKIYTEYKSILTTDEDAFKKLDNDDILLVQSLSKINKKQLLLRLQKNVTFECDFPISLNSITVDLPLLFYDLRKLMMFLYRNDGLKTFQLNCFNIDKLKDNEFFYIEAGCLLTKNQFISILQNKLTIPSQQKKSQNQQQYVHTIHDGTVLIEDIKRNDEPLKLNGKYDFIPIGDDELAKSVNLKVLLQKKKVEIVTEEYVNKNKHKKKTRILESDPIVGSRSDFEKKKEDQENEEIITIEI